MGRFARFEGKVIKTGGSGRVSLPVGLRGKPRSRRRRDYFPAAIRLSSSVPISASL